MTRPEQIAISRPDPVFPPYAEKKILTAPAPPLAAKTTAAPAPPYPETSAYQEAVTFYEQGNYQEATASVFSQLTQDAVNLEQDVMAHFTLANLEHRKGKHRESQIHYKNALSLLDKYQPDEVIPDSDGMLARQLKELIRVTAACK